MPIYPPSATSQGVHPNSFSFRYLHLWTLNWIHQGAWGCVTMRRIHVTCKFPSIVLSISFHLCLSSQLSCHVYVFILLVYKSSLWKRLLTCKCVTCFKKSIMFSSNIQKNGVFIFTLLLLIIMCKLSNIVHYIGHTWMVFHWEKLWIRMNFMCIKPKNLKTNCY